MLSFYRDSRNRNGQRNSEPCLGWQLTMWTHPRSRNFRTSAHVLPEITPFDDLQALLQPVTIELLERDVEEELPLMVVVHDTVALSGFYFGLVQSVHLEKAFLVKVKTTFMRPLPMFPSQIRNRLLQIRCTSKLEEVSILEVIVASWW